MNEYFISVTIFKWVCKLSVGMISAIKYLSRSTSVYEYGDDSHVQYDPTRSYESAPPAADHNYSTVDAIILDTQIMEKRQKHTVSDPSVFSFNLKL